MFVFFFLMIRRPPRSTRTDTLFPYTTLFRSLHFLLETVFAGLPDDARLLCVGAGTGAEIAHLAQRFPGWRFLALDPSPAMPDACRTRAERDGFADRVGFHAGLVDTLPEAAPFDGAPRFLVSQFLLDRTSVVSGTRL